MTVKIEMKNSLSLTGFYNGKNYNGTIYINQMTLSGIDWKHSTKIEFSKIDSITPVTAAAPKPITKNNLGLCPHCHTYCYGDCQN
jgi:hypothetical protein